MILGITGGSGCGKTTLLRLIDAQGGLVMDCDAIYHQLLQEDQLMLSRLQDRFPTAFENGILNRKQLGTLVFRDAQALTELNRITHSAVKHRVEQMLEARPSLAAIDAIALFESGLSELCDLTVTVTAPEEARIQRLMLRDNITRDYAISRIRAQHSPQWFIQRCDRNLENNGSEADFRKQCASFLQREVIAQTQLTDRIGEKYDC